MAIVWWGSSVGRSRWDTRCDGDHLLNCVLIQGSVTPFPLPIPCAITDPKETIPQAFLKDMDSDTRTAFKNVCPDIGKQLTSGRGFVF